MITLLNGVTGVGPGPAVNLKFSTGPRKVIVVFEGTWGTGGAAELQISADGLGGSWVTLSSDVNSVPISATGNKTFSFWLSSDVFLRGNVTADTGITVNLTLF